jgi:hypothetical protein
MGMPAVLTQTGTGVVIWTPDWMQNPFQVAIGISGGSTAASGTAQVDISLNDINPVDVNGISSAVTTTWLTVVAAAQFTTTMATALLTTPCQAIRLNVIGATATTVFTLNLIQPTFGR